MFATGDQASAQLTKCAVVETKDLSVHELDEQLAHSVGLLLLHPMPSAIDEGRTSPLCADAGRLHRLEDTRRLVGPPVALAGDEAGRHVDRAAGERAQLGEC